MSMTDCKLTVGVDMARTFIDSTAITWGDSTAGTWPYKTTIWPAPSTEPVEIETGHIFCSSNWPAWEQKEEGEYMQIYEVVVVNTKDCEIVSCEKVIAENEKKAMLELDLSKEIRKKIKQGLVELIFNHLGEFKKYQRRVKVVDE